MTVTCTPASGSTFTVGTTAVSCTAVDAASRQAQCSFSVTLTPLMHQRDEVRGVWRQPDRGAEWPGRVAWRARGGRAERLSDQTASVAEPRISGAEHYRAELRQRQ